VAGGPIRYVCFLYDPAAAGAPEKLFEATVGHAGYVAAGLAVAWHPDGKGLDFVESASPVPDPSRGIKLVPDPPRHHVRSFDLPTRQAGAPFTTGEHVVVGSSHGRAQRFMLVSGAGSDSGLWVHSGGAWWRVPDSQPDSPHLESLRRHLPRWSRDGAKL